jgi:hypothetical protein
MGEGKSGRPILGPACCFREFYPGIPHPKLFARNDSKG